MTLFDCLSEIIRYKTGTLHEQEGFKKAWNTYMILRYLSMDERFMDIAAEMNHYQGILSDVQVYKFLVKMVPQSNSSFIKYIKPKKK